MHRIDLLGSQLKSGLAWKISQLKKNKRADNVNLFEKTLLRFSIKLQQLFNDHDFARYSMCHLPANTAEH